MASSTVGMRIERITIPVEFSLTEYMAYPIGGTGAFVTDTIASY